MAAPTYYVFIPVRDSADSIRQVMDSLLQQTMPPKMITVVDDGSTDGTSEILCEFKQDHNDMIRIITTKSTTRDYSRLPQLWNMCLQKGHDYHMLSAGDTIFEHDYSEKILLGMQKNPNIVVASGDEQTSAAILPHGAGRFVRQDFFYKFYAKYPEIVGYESEILFRAIIEGYETRVFHEAKFEHTDQLGHSHNFVEFGMGMKSLGYHPLFVLGRVLLLLRGGKCGEQAWGTWDAIQLCKIQTRKVGIFFNVSRRRAQTDKEAAGKTNEVVYTAFPYALDIAAVSRYFSNICLTPFHVSFFQQG